MFKFDGINGYWFMIFYEIMVMLSWKMVFFMCLRIRDYYLDSKRYVLFVWIVICVWRIEMF